MTKMPTLYIPHGGGPCFFMEDPEGVWTQMETYLRGVKDRLPARPKAILVISAHWEETTLTVQATPHPDMIYDYYGFPPHTYQLSYPAPGSADLAARVRQLLDQSDIANHKDDTRGYDHGVFIPLMVMFPDADIPVIQLSLRHDLDPGFHVRVGQSLAPLRDEGVLIVGSGLSYHNLRHFRGTTDANPQAAAFDTWLTETLAHTDAVTRAQGLAQWAAAPGGRFCHPREEHLLPLMVVCGAAKSDPGRRAYTELVMGKAVSAFEFG